MEEHEADGRRIAERQILNYEEQLRALTVEISLAEERERRRISMGLHDDVGQTLAVARMKLGQLKHEGPSSIRPDLEEIQTLIERALQTTRSLTFELSSPVLYELGLEEALLSMGERLEAEHGIGFRFTSDGQMKPLAEDAVIVLFRTCREIFRNIAKHAGARFAALAVVRAGDRVQISIEDDGKGIDTAAIAPGIGPAGGFGLFSIREQLKRIGGHMRIEGAPGNGTKIVVSAPLLQGADEPGASQP